MKPLKISYVQGMVNIDSDDISYANIPNMYKTENGNGYGLQTTNKVKRNAAKVMCDKITDAVRDYHTCINTTGNEC